MTDRSPVMWFAYLMVIMILGAALSAVLHHV
jgi:hypothetical protein